MGRQGRPERSLLRPMDLSEILDGAFGVFRKAWPGMLLLGLIASVPALAAGYINYTVIRSSAFWVGLIGQGKALPSAISPQVLLTSVVVSVLTSLVGLFILPFVRGAIVELTADVVLGRPPALGAALRAGGRRYGAMLGTYLLLLPLWLLAAVPPVLLALRRPGPMLSIAVLVPWSLAVSVAAFSLAVYLVFISQGVVAEGLWGPAAYRRSLRLVHRRFWPLAGLGVLFYLLASALAGIFGGLTGGPLMGIGMATHNTALVGLTQFVGVLPTIVTTPFMLIGQTLAYYETRVRKEGLDLELLLPEPVAGQP